MLNPVVPRDRVDRTLESSRVGLWEFAKLFRARSRHAPVHKRDVAASVREESMTADGFWNRKSPVVLKTPRVLNLVARVEPWNSHGF